MSDKNPDELLRTVKARKDRLLKFDGQADDGGRVTWYVGYLGKYGWSACRWSGDWMDNPDEDEIRAAFDVCDDVKLVDRTEIPDRVDV